MDKIPSLLRADGTLNPKHQWVLAGDGTATQMYDGLCYAVIDGKPYSHIVTVQLAPDMLLCGTHGKQFWAWEPVPLDRHHTFWTCWRDDYDSELWDWSYELVGRSINKDPEHVGAHVLRAHGKETIRALQTPTLVTLREYLSTHDIEGVVWWEDVWDLDCRKVKVQQADLGLKRKPRKHSQYA